MEHNTSFDDMTPIAPKNPTTTQLSKQPLILNKNNELANAVMRQISGSQGQFSDDARLILQLLPSGVCIVSEIDRPLILGRGDPTQHPDCIDLAPHRAQEHGVSRRHASLKRQGQRLLITDLKSSNGTYVSGQRLSPYRPVTLAHGDEIILGSLHLMVTFWTA